MTCTTRRNNGIYSDDQRCVRVRPISPEASARLGTEDGISVYFSLDGGATYAIVGEIEKAKKSLDLQAYSYTSVAIAKATADAHKRGVAVRVTLDKSNRTDRYSAATHLMNEGVPAFIDDITRSRTTK